MYMCVAVYACMHVHTIVSSLQSCMDGRGVHSLYMYTHVHVQLTDRDIVGAQRNELLQCTSVISKRL